MEDKQDNWEKFLNLTDEYQPDPEIANRVIEKINQRESTVAFKKPLITKKFAIILSCFLFAVVVFLAVFLPVHFNGSKSDITLYTSENIEFEEIEILKEFVLANSLDVKYLDTDLVNNRVAKIKSNSEIGYISQNAVFIGESSFDKIVLRIVVMPNSKFEFYKDFEALTQSINVSGIEIDFLANYNIVNTGQQIKYFAKFNFENYDYYLELETSETETTVLEKYIKILIN